MRRFCFSRMTSSLLKPRSWSVQLRARTWTPLFSREALLQAHVVGRAAALRYGAAVVVVVMVVGGVVVVVGGVVGAVVVAGAHVVRAAAARAKPWPRKAS